MVAAVLLGCDRPPAVASAPRVDPARPAAVRAAPVRRAVQLALVDSARYENEIGTYAGFLCRVAVRSAGRVDTIPGVVTDATPVVVGDTAVVGLRSDHDLTVGLFRYDVRTRQVRDLPRPAGWAPWSAPALAPDGRHVAWVGADGPARSYGAVARVADGAVVYRGPAVGSRETDARVDDVRWTSPAQFEIRIDLPLEVRGALRVRGQVTPVRAVIDTVPDSGRASGSAPAA